MEGQGAAALREKSGSPVCPPTAPSTVHDASILCVISHLYYLCHFPILRL